MALLAGIFRRNIDPHILGLECYFGILAFTSKDTCFYTKYSLTKDVPFLMERVDFQAKNALGNLGDHCQTLSLWGMEC